MVTKIMCKPNDNVIYVGRWCTLLIVRSTPAHNRHTSTSVQMSRKHWFFISLALRGGRRFSHYYFRYCLLTNLQSIYGQSFREHLTTISNQELNNFRFLRISILSRTYLVCTFCTHSGSLAHASSCFSFSFVGIGITFDVDFVCVFPDLELIYRSVGGRITEYFFQSS